MRFLEVLESLRLIRKIALGLPAGPVRAEAGENRRNSGLGASRRLAGGNFSWPWAGRRAHPAAAIATTPRGRTGQCWNTPWWAISSPTFPLINKSFNLSYSGQDR